MVFPVSDWTPTDLNDLQNQGLSLHFTGLAVKPQLSLSPTPGPGPGGRQVHLLSADAAHATRLDL